MLCEHIFHIFVEVRRFARRSYKHPNQKFLHAYQILFRVEPERTTNLGGSALSTTGNTTLKNFSS